MKPTILSLLLCFSLLLGCFAAPLAGAEEAPEDLIDVLLDKILLHEEAVDTSLYALSAEQMDAKIAQLVLTRPECFLVENFSYTLSEEESPTVLQVLPQYAMDAPSSEQALQYCLSQARALASAASGQDLQPEAFLKVHELFIQSYECSDSSDASDAYAFFLNEGGNSHGAAMAFQMICEQMGIESQVVISTQMNRSWNTVRILGARYHTDTAADDSRSIQGQISRKYCLLSDQALSLLGYTDFAQGSCSSQEFDNAFWREITSPILATGGYIFYLNTNDGSLCRALSLNYTGEAVTRVEGTWTDATGAPLEGIYSGLCLHEETLYFNTPTQIIAFNYDNNRQSVYATPVLDEGQQIFNLWCEDSRTLSYAAGSDPMSATTASNSVALPEVETYTIIFLSDNNIYYTYKLTKGSTIYTPPVSPKKSSTDQGTYQFVGWNGYHSGMKALEDKIFHATFAFTPYPVVDVPPSSPATTLDPQLPPSVTTTQPNAPVSTTRPSTPAESSPAAPKATTTAPASIVAPSTTLPPQPSGSARPTYGNQANPGYSHHFPQNTSPSHQNPSGGDSSYEPEEEQPKDHTEGQGQEWKPWAVAIGGSVLVVGLIILRETVLLPRKRRNAEQESSPSEGEEAILTEAPPALPPEADQAEAPKEDQSQEAPAEEEQDAEPLQ